jgi:hypothetical protein
VRNNDRRDRCVERGDRYDPADAHSDSD